MLLIFDKVINNWKNSIMFDNLEKILIKLSIIFMINIEFFSKIHVFSKT